MKYDTREIRELLTTKDVVYTIDKLAENIGVSRATVGRWETELTGPKKEKDVAALENYLKKINFDITKLSTYIDFSKQNISQKVDFVKEENAKYFTTKNLIPFYEAESIGGMNHVANMEAITAPTCYIESGGWFKNATGAMRHYNDSMIEYPSGCIIAFKHVQDKELLLWGNNYVIETSEYRITKKITKSNKEGYILAHSTNQLTRYDGSLIYPPIEIPLNKINFIALVLGKIEKEVS